MSAIAPKETTARKVSRIRLNVHSNYVAIDHRAKMIRSRDGIEQASVFERLASSRSDCNAQSQPFGCPRSRSDWTRNRFSLRKEVIQPQVLLRLPCYDFTPIMNYTLGGCSLAVSAPTSSATHFRDVTGGVYKARERIHRGVLIRDY